METHSQPKLPRKLAAVLYADVQGYSRLIGFDEEATHRETAACIELFRNKSADYGGRIVRAEGDSVLAEMQSAVDAVKFAAEMQSCIAERNLEQPVEKRIEFRIGVNLGDIIVDQQEIFGDSVNIAERLQAFSYPGGICISKAVYEQVQAKLAYGYEFMGPQELKNIVHPVEVYRVRFDQQPLLTQVHHRAKEEPLELPDRPSVAVLPFQNLSQDEREIFLSDGITDDLTIALSKFRELFVIARNSAFQFELRSRSPREIGRELGVRYLVEGSIRHQGRRLRITTRLIDAEMGQEIWGERYDHYLDELFDVLDELTERIASILARQIQALERRRALKAKPESLEAYGLVLCGQELLFMLERRANAMARKHYERAVDLDPSYARAYASISRTLNYEWRYSWSEDRHQSLEMALDFATKAINLDEYDARGFSELGFVQLYKKQHDASIAAYERALELNPNDADLLAEMGDSLVYSRQAERSVELLKRAMRLNPFYPDWYLWYLGDAYFHLGDYEETVRTVLKMRDQSEGHRLLASSYAHLDRMDEARHHAEQVMKAHPNFSIARWRNVPPNKFPEQLEVFIEGLRKAGLK